MESVDTIEFLSNKAIEYFILEEFLSETLAGTFWIPQ